MAHPKISMHPSIKELGGTSGLMPPSPGRRLFTPDKSPAKLAENDDDAERESRRLNPITPHKNYSFLIMNLMTYFLRPDVQICMNANVSRMKRGLRRSGQN